MSALSRHSEPGSDAAVLAQESRGGVRMQRSSGAALSLVGQGISFPPVTCRSGSSFPAVPKEMTE